MTTYSRLYYGISKAAWGYFFLYFDINIGTISLLPSFIGYILFTQAINLLSNEEREFAVLRPFAVLMTVWSLVEWICKIFAFDISTGIRVAGIVFSIIALYFNFQFITNIASLAARYQNEGCEYDKKLLILRTVQIIMHTCFIIISNFYFLFNEIWTVISVILMLIYCVVCIFIMARLFGLRKNLKPDDFETENPSEAL